MWESKKMARWGHTAEGIKALGGKKAVKEWDDATPKGSLPEKKIPLREIDFRLSQKKKS